MPTVQLACGCWVETAAWWLHRLRKMAMGGSGDMTSIFIYISGLDKTGWKPPPDW